MDGVVVAAEDVAVMLGPVVVLEPADVDGLLVVWLVVELPGLSVSLPYVQRVPVKIPKSSPPTTSMPIIVMSMAVGRLTASAD